MVPDGWREVTFGQVARFRNGLNFTQNSQGEEVKIVGIPHFWRREISSDHADLEPIRIAGALSEEDLLTDGDLLFVRSNGNRALIGRCLLFQNIKERISFSGFTIRARVYKENVESAFLAYVMRSSFVRSQFLKLGGGTNISNLSQEILNATKLLLPPLPEQAAIRELLSKWDHAISVTEGLIRNSELQKLGLMQQLLAGARRFDDAGHVPWALRPLKSLCDVRRGASPRPIDDPKWFSVTGRGWVRISDVTASQTEHLESTEQYLSPLGAEKSVPVDPGELIMSICATIGVPKIVGIPVCIHDGFVVFRDVDSSLDLEFLYYLLEFKTRQLANSGQPGTQKNLNTSIVGNIQIPVLPRAEQRKVVATLRVADERIRKEKIGRDQLQLQKIALMQQLLSGKRRIRVRDLETVAVNE